MNASLPIIVDNADTRFLQISLQKTKKVLEIIFACSCGAHVESFKQKKVKKSHDNVPLSHW